MAGFSLKKTWHKVTAIATGVGAILIMIIAMSDVGDMVDVVMADELEIVRVALDERDDRIECIGVGNKIARLDGLIVAFETASMQSQRPPSELARLAARKLEGDLSEQQAKASGLRCERFAQ